jgi:hypothetical protein
MRQLAATFAVYAFPVSRSSILEFIGEPETGNGKPKACALKNLIARMPIPVPKALESRAAFRTQAC